MNWASIQYRGFWDVPRIFIVRHGGALYLFDCAFSQELDDYPDAYCVYALPEIRDNELPTDWTLLKDRAICKLGEVPVDSVQFDATRRQQVDAGILELLGDQSVRAG